MTGRRRRPECSGDCMLLAFRGTSTWARVGHTFGSMCGLVNQSAGVARRLFFLLRHLSKFPSFKNEIHRVVSEIWPWASSMLHLKREVCLRIPEYAGVVRCGAFATKARKCMVVETSFAGALVRECTDCVRRASLRARRCC